MIDDSWMADINKVWSDAARAAAAEARRAGAKAKKHTGLSEHHHGARQRFSIFSPTRFRHVSIGANHKTAADFYRSAKEAYDKKDSARGKFFAESGDVFANKAKAASKKHGL